MKRRYYFDTSVFGGVFDEEFKEDSLRLFELVKRREIICLISDLVEDELKTSPKHVRKHSKNYERKIKKLGTIHRIRELADLYQAMNIVGKSYEDCLHIAFATIYNVDALISWNFKHIVNENLIAQYNAVNLRFGYRAIKIYSPKQFLTYEKSNKKKIS